MFIRKNKIVLTLSGNNKNLEVMIIAYTKSIHLMILYHHIYLYEYISI